MSVTPGYELTGRTKQKTRTRAALVMAARELLSQGVAPTVEQAAAEAGISRTTAYRYFPNQRALVLAGYPELDASSLLGSDAPDDPSARLEIVTEQVARQIIEHEHELRAMLRVSLESPAPGADSLPLRQGRVIGWIEDALAPLREGVLEPKIHNLALAIRATLGIEALTWLTDVGGLSRAQAADLMRSSARTLLQAALADAGITDGPSGPG